MSDLAGQCGEGNLRKSFLLKIFEKKTLQNICYFFKFSVQYHFHEHFCNFGQLIGKALIEIEVAVVEQIKNVQFCFFQNILQAAIFYPHQRDI